MIWELLLLIVLLVLLVYVGMSVLYSRDEASDIPVDWDDDSDNDGAGGSVKRQLQTLKLDVEPWAFALGTILFAALVSLLFLEVFPEQFLLASLSGVGMLIFSFFLLHDLSSRRTRGFELDLTHAIDLIQTSLQGGENAVGALTVAGRSSRKAVRTEIMELVRRIELGMPVDVATQRMETLYQSEGVRLFSRALQVKWLAGGDLSELLGSVNRIIRERIRFRTRMTAQLSGMKYSSIFVAILPYLVIPFFMWKNPAWLHTLMEHELGPSLLFGAILLQLLGFFWLRSILRYEAS